MATANTKRKPAAKAAPKKTTARKAAPKKAAARKAAPKKAAPRLTKAQENARNVFLAGLGAYGKAFDEAQSQIKEAQSQMKQNRAKAEKLFNQLVKRGEKVESLAKSKIKELDLPELKMPEVKLADREEVREELRARIEKARSSFDTLLQAITPKATA